MALEFIGGTLFTLLYDGVKQAMSKSSTFKSLLGDLKSTLDSLVPRDIQQIEEHNVELGLPNDEIESLKLQMEEGVKLVVKLSNFRMWNYCCLYDYADQIVELDRALKRLLQKLKMQEARDVKEVLLLSRQNRDKLDEVNRRLLDIQKLLQQRAGEGGSGLENLVSGSSTETAPPEQTQGNGGEQVTSFDGGASLEAVFLALFDAVIGAKDKTVMFKPLFENLISTLESLKPLTEEVTKHKKILDRAEKRLEDFRIHMENGVELIDKCAKDHLWACCKQYKYTDRLLRLDESLQILLNILKVLVARDVKQTFASVQHIEAVIKQIEESGVLQDQIQARGRNALPESLSPTVGLDVLNVQGTRDLKEALLSVGDKKAVAEKIEGSGVVQNQSEIEGLRPSSKLLTILVPSTFRTEGEIVQSSNLKAFRFDKLKTATRNFHSDCILGEGHLGSVFKGWVDENSLTTTKPGTGMVVAVKRIDQEYLWGDHRELLAEISYHGQLHHENLVRLIGYCLEDDHRLLVYEYIPCGSLDRHLFSKSSSSQPLPWNLRMRIALGAAKGLAFLHSAERRVMFRHFKTSDILLDSMNNAKLTDFGLARGWPAGVKTHVSTNGYAAPEYIATGFLTAKSDVNSFGVVLLEMLSGRPVVDKNRPSKEHNLVEWAKPYLASKRKVFKIFDARFEGQYPSSDAREVVKLAIQCLADDPKSRPNMNDEVKILEQLQKSEPSLSAG
ncbi:uncharacterized protein [Pyrus communis]|uniref:uncharacterized protein isoform X2 n=1 Tax=Pyrus communis TaxID=23211 RepID=UPI0035BFBBED